jgi:hypothetical protein
MSGKFKMMSCSLDPPSSAPLRVILARKRHDGSKSSWLTLAFVHQLQRDEFSLNSNRLTAFFSQLLLSSLLKLLFCFIIDYETLNLTEINFINFAIPLFCVAGGLSMQARYFGIKEPK